MKDMLNKEIDTFILYSDSQYAIVLVKNPIHHHRSKHKIAFHKKRNIKWNSKIISHNYQRKMADILTKPMSRYKTDELDMF